jgi:hypothetical protein
MAIKKEKYLVSSVVILVLGWVYFIIVNYLNYIDYFNQFTGAGFISFPRLGKYDTLGFKLIAIIFGLVSLYFAFTCKPNIQNHLRILLILMSVILIVLSIVIFPNCYVIGF